MPLVALGAAVVIFGIFPHLLMGTVNSGMEPAMALLARLQAAPALLGGVFQ